MHILYPQSLHPIFMKLITHGIEPVIVGGFVRDAILGRESHDIDIELYNLNSFIYLETLLKSFGSANSVGKSFGVCKLNYKNLELDFSLPRRDSKIDKGHQGFHIELDTSLDFKIAASRRDFTINAIGYDVKNQKFLDPFHGIEDIKKAYLRAVDLKKFDEDPLRVLRAIMFHARFQFQLENKLFLKCKDMMQKNVLQELPRERIFQEMKKILLQSKKPSLGFLLLKQLDGFLFFHEFQSLKESEYKKILQSLDILQNYKTTSQEDTLAISLALLTSKFTPKEQKSFLDKLTQSKKLRTKIDTLTQTQCPLESYNNYDIYKLATKIDIALYANYCNALLHEKEKEKITLLVQKAKKLGVLHTKSKPLITGKMLLAYNITPSKKYSKILDDAYEAQLREEFKNTKEAAIWLSHYIDSKSESNFPCK